MTDREPLTAEGAHIRNLYAYFGLAMYAAQCIEHSLVLLFVYATSSGRGDVVDGDIDRLFERGFEQTLGRLIASVRSVIDTGPDLESRLSKALRVRNWLAHDYFRENGIAAIMVLVRRLGQARGITDEMIERERAKLVRRGDDLPGSRRWRERREAARCEPGGA